MTEPYAAPESPGPPGASGGSLATSSWGRPLGVLVSPQPTFRSIAERPSWLPPLLVLLVLFVAVQVLMSQRIDLEAAMRDAMARSDQQLTEEQIERAAEFQSRFGVACNALTVPVFLVVAALIFWGLANLAGGEIDFVRSLSVTLHGLMPNAVAWLLSVPVILGRQEIGVVEAQNGILASHLAVFAPADAPVWLTALLGRVDLFALWAVALLVIGFRRVAGLSAGAATAIVLVVWAIWVALIVGLISMQGAGAG